MHLPMVEDTVKELGLLALGTRLKRLGERLQAQSQELLDAAGFTLPASHFPVLAALERRGRMSVGELAETLGVTQPGVTRMLEKLESEGLVESQRQAGDRRVRMIVLSRAGERFVARAKSLAWPQIEAAVADACEGPARSLLHELTALEDALAEAPLRVRATRLRLKVRAHGPS
jgi:DNA-binding MarR family transcriptional regulator